MPQGPVPSPACSCLGLPHMYLTCRQTPAIAYTPPCPASWLSRSSPPIHIPPHPLTAATLALDGGEGGWALAIPAGG